MAHAYVALTALAALGFLDALYFLLVGLGWMRPDAAFVPRVCRMDAGTCLRILDTRWGRLFGIPNAYPGMAWYAVLAGAGLYGWLRGSIPSCEILLAASVAVLAVSVLLAWALVARLKTFCVLCFLAHAINLAVVPILAVAC